MGRPALDQKRAVVTGAASGIGFAIAREFAREGASVALLDLHEESLEKASQEIEALTSQRSTVHVCDVSKEADVERAFAEVAGPLDFLVNSAGVAHIGTVQNTMPADFDRLYQVNVRGTFLCMQAAVKTMSKDRGGAMLNMASIAATAGLADRFAYSMTKGAVLAMTLSAAKDCLSAGIRCNCISPARVHTPFVDGFVARNYPGREEEMMAVLSASQPIGRMGTPDEIARLAVYLCSDEASFITGSDIPIDGGFATLR